MKPHRVAALLLAAAFAACSDSPGGPAEAGPPASIALNSGTPSALANTDLTGLTVVVKDANGTPVPNQAVTFAVTAGGGSIQQTTGTTGADGTVAVPTWRLGKSADQQTITVTAGSATFPLNATVTTSYSIVIRYYGTQPTDAQKALFSAAANRIRGVIIDELQNIPTGVLDISDCLGQSAGTTVLNNETIDDLVIYATVLATGGSSTIASAGPCYYRNTGTDTMQTVLGVMRFSPDFLSSLPPAVMQNVIMHEMLHVVGVGSWWLGSGCANCGQPGDPRSPGWNLVADTATIPRFTGPNAKSECQAIGGTVTCANGVPVEDDTSRGTGDVHWEESIFGNELMTGFANNGPMPFSRITIGSLKDIRLDVNSAAFDDFTVVPFTGSALRFAGPLLRVQEQPLTSPLYGLDANGRVTAVRKRK